MRFTAMGQLIRIHFWGKTAFCFTHIKFEMPVWHPSRKIIADTYNTVFISFYIYLYLKLHGKVRGKDRSHESQQYNTANIEALKHTTPSSCAAVKFLVIFHTLVQTLSPKDIFPDHPGLIPFSFMCFKFFHLTPHSNYLLTQKDRGLITLPMLIFNMNIGTSVTDIEGSQ